MKNFLKKYYRDVVTGLMLTVSLTLIMFVGFNGSRMLGAFREDRRNWYAGKYAYTYIFAAEKSIKIQDYPSGSIQEENPYLLEDMAASKQGVSLEVTGLHEEGSLEFISVMLLLSRGKEDDYLLESLDERVSEENGIWIGRSRVRNTKAREGRRYAVIQGQGEYPVQGMLVNQSASGYDDRMILPYETMSADRKELWKEVLQNKFRLYVAGDNDKEVQAECHRLLEMLDKAGYSVEEERSDEDSMEQQYRYFAKLLLPLFMIFCIGNIVVVVRLWMMRKKREMAICKSLGAGTFFQMRRLLWGFFKCLLPSAVLGFLLELAYSAWEGRSINLSNYVNPQGCVLLLGMLAVFVGNMLLYVRFIRSVPPATGMKEK